MNRIFNLVSWVGIALVVAALGVFYGMIGVTVFGLVFTPLFYVLCRKLALRFSRSVPRVRVLQPGETKPPHELQHSAP